METVNIHYAKTHLSKLIEKAVHGEPFVIAKAGKPMVEVRAWPVAEEPKPSRIGFMKGYGVVPDDIKAFGREEILEMFGLEE